MSADTRCSLKMSMMYWWW